MKDHLMVRCGEEVPIGHLRLKSSKAKYALWYYGFVRYYATEKAANRAFDKLPDYYKQVATVEPTGGGWERFQVDYPVE